MERPPADTPTAHLWRTLFALVVEPTIRSGLVTEHDLVPAGPVDTRNEEVPNAEEGEGLQEQGEESADEHDPIVEFDQRRNHEPPRMYCLRQSYLTLRPLRSQRLFFLIAGCNGSRGYWQSLATRE